MHGQLETEQFAEITKKSWLQIILFVSFLFILAKSHPWRPRGSQ